MKFKLLIIPFLLTLGSCGQSVATNPPDSMVAEVSPAPVEDAISLGLKQQSTTCATTLQKQLDILTKGLLYLSESDYPFTSFHLPALQTLPSGTVDPAGSFTFATAVGMSGQPVTTQTLDEFFAQLTEFRPSMTPAERRTAARYLMLKAF